MSSCFDVMQDALAKLDGPREIKTSLRTMIDMLHGYDHDRGRENIDLADNNKPGLRKQAEFLRDLLEKSSG